MQNQVVVKRVLLNRAVQVATFKVGRKGDVGGGVDFDVVKIRVDVVGVQTVNDGGFGWFVVPKRDFLPFAVDDFGEVLVHVWSHFELFVGLVLLVVGPHWQEIVRFAEF